MSAEEKKNKASGEKKQITTTVAAPDMESKYRLIEGIQRATRYYEFTLRILRKDTAVQERNKLFQQEGHDCALRGKFWKYVTGV